MLGGAGGSNEIPFFLGLVFIDLGCWGDWQLGRSKRGLLVLFTVASLFQLGFINFF